MSLDDPGLLARADAEPWRDPAGYWPAFTAATRELDPPLGALSLPALAANARDLQRRARGMPIRVASKSLRSRPVIDQVLRLPGFAGVLAYTLPEALWLAETVEDVIVGYPSTDRAAIARLAASEGLAARVTLMVDDIDQLELIDAVAPSGHRAELRVAIDIDVSFDRLGTRIGVWRSPLHEPAAVRILAERILARPGFRLVGLLAYEAQIAGVADRPRGRPARGMLLRRIQAASVRELAPRRAEAVRLVREIADISFVNGGGTGSFETTRVDDSVTELTAGSGLYGSHLFDHYSSFEPAPAAAFALPVVRRPAPRKVTVLGGGWVASGVPGPDRLPLPVWPPGLRSLALEGAGEVQTPLTGARADGIALGDRVWFRHAKAGELAEHLDRLQLVDGDRLLGEVPSYRGEGRAFL